MRRLLRLIPPALALRCLLTLDNWLYVLESSFAVAYGGGIHPKHRHMRYHEFFIARIGPADSVLDIGCGNGAVAYDIATRTGALVVGMEIEPAKIAEATRRHVAPRLYYVVGDALAILPQGRFSVVVLSNVLEHLPRRPDFLRRLAQSAQPERILIRVPLFERDWRIPLKQELGVEWRLDKTHETEYTLESFAAEMEVAGLRTAHLEVRWGEIWAEVLPVGAS